MSCLTHCDVLTSPYDRADFKTSSYACSRRRLSSKVSKTTYFSNMEFNVYDCQCNTGVRILLLKAFEYWELSGVLLDFRSLSKQILVGFFKLITVDFGTLVSHEQRIKIRDRVGFYLSISPARSRFGRVPRRSRAEGFPKEELSQNLVSSANFCELTHVLKFRHPAHLSSLSVSGLRVLLVHP